MPDLAAAGLKVDRRRSQRADEFPAHQGIGAAFSGGG